MPSSDHLFATLPLSTTSTTPLSLWLKQSALAQTQPQAHPQQQPQAYSTSLTPRTAVVSGPPPGFEHVRPALKPSSPLAGLTNSDLLEPHTSSSVNISVDHEQHFSQRVSEGEGEGHNDQVVAIDQDFEADDAADAADGQSNAGDEATDDDDDDDDDDDQDINNDHDYDDGCDFDPLDVDGPTSSRSMRSAKAASHRNSVRQSTRQARAKAAPRPPPTKATLQDFVFLRVIGQGAYGKVFLVRRKDRLGSEVQSDVPNSGDGRSSNTSRCICGSQ
eukprot:jgi/Hompol1/1760/HPOL_000016-RA